tara:strand:+ start:27 stop:596 length:570 start_codon:yes stop_codon:yes gene_type:complete
MKRLLLIFILTFTFQSLTKADDISDLKIEEMSVGESSLDFFTNSEILKNTKNWYTDNKFTTFQIRKKFKIYDSIQISFQTNDPKKRIAQLDGIIYYTENINKCYKKIDEIYNEIKSIIPNLKDEGKLTYKHTADKTGKSTITDYVLLTENNDEIQIACYDYSVSNGGADHLRVGFRLVSFRKFLSEAYN